MFHFGPATAHFGPSPWVTRALPSGSLEKKSFMKPGGVTRPPPPTVITEDAAGMRTDALKTGPASMKIRNSWILSPSKRTMSAQGRVTELPSLRQYMTSISTHTVSPRSVNDLMSWERASTPAKNAVTDSLIAGLSRQGSPLPNWYTGLSVKKLTNPAESNASPLAKRRTTDFAITPEIRSAI